ncbi:hypothetical protein [Nostoc sp. 2RC]|uniref:hypothetical protein n=1 Tax=Nostoc sp. 2RC TaxID=2485484 RepID=UPI0016270117|nr:hypothetical protein [Nostoc sp. 2RC]MBC1236889.1 hypothetical protein [Nostoc sp. 2RC]
MHELFSVASEAIVADISFFVVPTYDRKLEIGHWALGMGHWALGMGYEGKFIPSVNTKLCFLHKNCQEKLLI